MSRPPSHNRVLVHAPIGADARNIVEVLGKAGHGAKICSTDADVALGITEECGAVVLTEEVLTPEVIGRLGAAFRAQPPWSDVPVILIVSPGADSFGASMAPRLRGPGDTVTLLERPLRSATLLSTLATLLAARRRQFEIRDLLHERDDLLNSLELRVAQRTAELSRMVEEMEAFSYSVSHDLRSPLRSLAGYADALQEDYGSELPAGARSYCEKIVRAARRMDSLTQDVLAYTRVTQCDMQVVAVDLDPLIAEVIEQYPALVSAARRIQVNGPLGWVSGHAPSLIQCFSNLLGNALKFVPPQREPFIQIRSVREGERIRVSVTDNGAGIAPDDHARIFRMFERAADKSVPGTGIGLAIVKKAVERMGGSIGVKSTLGQGSEFWLDLRAAEPVPLPARPVVTSSPFWEVEKAASVPRVSFA